MRAPTYMVPHHSRGQPHPITNPRACMAWRRSRRNFLPKPGRESRSRQRSVGATSAILARPGPTPMMRNYSSVQTYTAFLDRSEFLQARADELPGAGIRDAEMACDLLHCVAALKVVRDGP